jgi:hypothetical protein
LDCWQSPPVVISARQQPAVTVDADDLGGMVTSMNGPEPGVWVIAETTDLPTKFAASSSPTSGAAI